MLIFFRKISHSSWKSTLVRTQCTLVRTHIIIFGQFNTIIYCYYCKIWCTINKLQCIQCIYQKIVPIKCLSLLLSNTVRTRVHPGTKMMKISTNLNTQNYLTVFYSLIWMSFNLSNDEKIKKCFYLNQSWIEIFTYL